MGNSNKKQSNQPSRITEQDKAILQLKQMRDKLKQYKKKIEVKLEKERELAKELVKNGKIEKAKLLLKKKKYYENNLEKTDAQLDNIDQLVHTLEFTQIEHQVVNSLKTGNDCLKKLHELMSIDEIEQIMDDTREGIEYQRKIDELISGEFTDEAVEEIESELERIIGESLPEVPQDELEKQKKTEKIRQKDKEEANQEKKIAVLAD